MQIGAYTIERELGRGGFGIVYVGVDSRLGRRAAVKRLLPELSYRRDVVDRFFNEARAAAAINHPGIVEIYEVGWYEGSAFFAMKLLEGDSLGTRLRAVGMMAPAIATTIARQVAAALAAAHAANIVHRDLKPDNIVLVHDDEVIIGERATILDFGIAKLFGAEPSQRTATGTMMGTPAYMSPEQCRGAGEVDHRTDIYALGCIVFQMLAGRPPFVGQGGGEVLGMHQFVETPRLREFRPDLPEGLEAVVMRCLAKKPEDRYQAMTELASALQPYTSMTREAPVIVPSRAPVDPHAPTMASEMLPPRGNDPTVSATTLGRSSAEVRIAPPPEQPRTSVYAIGGIVVGLGAVAIEIAVTRDPEPPRDAALAVADAAVPDVAVAIRDASVDAGRAEIAAICKPHFAAQKWADAITCAETLPPDQRRVVVERAQMEQASDAGLRDLELTLRENKFADAYLAFQRIDRDSVAYARAWDRYKLGVGNYIVKYLGSAGNDCEKFESILDESEVDYGKQVVDYVRSQVTMCKGTECDAAQTKGQQALGLGRYTQALANFERALGCSPNDQTLLLQAAMAACRANEPKKAAAFVFQIKDATLATKVKQTCATVGITIPEL